MSERRVTLKDFQQLGRLLADNPPPPTARVKIDWSGYCSVSENSEHETEVRTVKVCKHCLRVVEDEP